MKTLSERSLVHNSISHLLGLIRNYLGFNKFLLLKVACLVCKPKLILTYNSSGKPDGVGAQLQRVLAIQSLAHNLGLSYLHTPISSVAIHPFDSYQSLQAMYEFVEEVNSDFFMENYFRDAHTAHDSYQIQSLTFSNFSRFMFRSLLTRKPVLISCTEPYGLIEFDPHKYHKIKEFLPNFRPSPKKIFTIAVHYRSGVGGKAIQFGEKLSREIDVAYFIKVIRLIFKHIEAKKCQIVIYTDAPLSNQEFQPPDTQGLLWDTSPGFKDGVMSILGIDLAKEFSEISSPVEVKFGGNPITAIKEMAGADILVIGRSSFSYLAALLNADGEIYFPKSFWHKPLKGWNVINDEEY